MEHRHENHHSTSLSHWLRSSHDPFAELGIMGSAGPRRCLGAGMITLTIFILALDLGVQWLDFAAAALSAGGDEL